MWPREVSLDDFESLENARMARFGSVVCLLKDFDCDGFGVGNVDAIMVEKKIV